MVVAYIDGFNLYYGLMRKYGRRYLWLDLLALVRQLRPGDQVLVVRYFTAVVKGEPAAAANQIDYIDALQAHCGPTLLDRLAAPPGGLRVSRNRPEPAWPSVSAVSRPSPSCSWTSVPSACRKRCGWKCDMSSARATCVQM
jgi:hypothetical protein